MTQPRAVPCLEQFIPLPSFREQPPFGEHTRKRGRASTQRDAVALDSGRQGCTLGESHDQVIDRPDRSHSVGVTCLPGAPGLSAGASQLELGDLFGAENVLFLLSQDRATRGWYHLQVCRNNRG